MNLTDEYAYIPLFATGVVSVVLFFLLLAVNKKKTARVSIITIVSTLVLAVGSIISAVKTLMGSENGFVLFGEAVAIVLLIMIPYCIILVTFEPKKITKLVPHSVNVADEVALEQQRKASEEASKGFSTSESDSKALSFSAAFNAKAAEAYGDKEGLASLLDYLNKTVKSEVNADGGAILMVDDFEDVITVKSFDGDFPPPYKLPSDMPHKPIRIATNFKFASFPLRDNIFGEIATAGKAELITKPEQDARIYQNGPEEFLECGSYIFVPLKVQDAVIGVMAYARTKQNPLFTEDEFNTVTALSDFAATAIKSVISVKELMEHNDLIKEAEFATKIQQTLHPSKLPSIGGIQIGTIWNPSEGVCGDYYDVIVSRKDRISFVMSDIAGKGLNSVIVMAMLRAMIRLVVNTKKTAGTILEWVNHGLSAESFSTDHFASCALINYDPLTHKVEVATGGTTPVYIYNSETKSVEQISEISEPIGVDKESVYKNIQKDVKPGDILVTYSDGLIEALNEDGRQYPKDALLELVKKNSGASSKDIANLIKADVKKFIGNSAVHDDQSLLVVKF